MKHTKFYKYVTAYGISHGIFIAVGMYLSYLVVPVMVLPVAVGGTVYYYIREAKARKTYDLRQWYTDSQWDAITPAIIAGAGAYLIYF